MKKCSSRNDLLLACYLSGQVAEQQWQEHLHDEVFRRWLEKEGHTTPT